MGHIGDRWGQNRFGRFSLEIKSARAAKLYHVSYHTQGLICRQKERNRFLTSDHKFKFCLVFGGSCSCGLKGNLHNF